MKYLVTIKKKETAKVILYYEEGLLTCLEIKTPSLTPEQISWIKQTMPASETFLKPLEGGFITVEEIPQDLSFNAFWEAYNYKVGKKERALKYWTALTETERMQVFKAIPKYNYWLAQRPNMDRLYPEGFLHQRRFENEFNKK